MRRKLHCLLWALLSLTGMQLNAQPCATPSSVTATPSVICPGGTSQLNAISTGNSINWYMVPVGGVAIGSSLSGANYAVTPSVTTTYYAEAISGVTGTQTFNYTGAVQNFVVPVGITAITIDAKGAQGGNSNGGKGARMIGTFAVTPGENIGIAVGQQGIVNNCGGGGASGGGGGGSFAWRVSNSTMPLIAAGGGGGGNMNWTGGPCTFGLDAVTTQDGLQGYGATSALGGTAGQGGFGNAPSGTGSGGAGWLSAGQNSAYGSGCTGGQGPFTFTGGNGASVFGPGGEGGFGGGGGAVCGCGGGGGFSGGGGGEGAICRSGGGGGGSYNSGTNQSNTPGTQLGNGQIVITWIGNGCTASNRIPVTVTLDNVAPVATCQPVTVNLDPNGNGSTTAAAVDNGSTDNCAVSSVALSQTAFTCANAGANTVTLTVTDATGNSATCTATVTVVGPAMTTSSTSDTTACGYNVSCPGGNDGIAFANVTGGCATYTYLWSNGQTSAIATGLGSGTFTVTITDASGSTSVASVTLTEPAALQMTSTTTPSCVSDADGSIDLEVTGGNDCGGYTYLWSNGATTADISGLAPGAYTVTVTDGGGCNNVASITVPALPTPAPTFTQAGNILTSAQVWSGYQWQFNGLAIPGATLDNYTATASGSYSLSVIDSNGCVGISDTTNVTIVGIAAQMADWVSLNLFPNPAHDAFSLRTGSPIPYPIKVTIHDLHGRVFMETALSELGQEAAFNIKDFAAGTYFVEVTSDLGHRKMFKLAIQ